MRYVEGAKSFLVLLQAEPSSGRLVLHESVVAGRIAIKSGQTNVRRLRNCDLPRGCRECLPSGSDKARFNDRLGPMSDLDGRNSSDRFSRWCPPADGRPSSLKRSLRLTEFPHFDIAPLLPLLPQLAPRRSYGFTENLDFEDTFGAKMAEGLF